MRTDTHTPKGSVLVVATMASFLTPFMGSSVNIALPSIGREFAMDAIVLGWVATSYLVAAAMFLVPFGRIADIYGRKKIFITGITIYTLASFLSGGAPSTVILIAFRVLQGIGSAMIFGTGVAMLTSVFPAGERGKALGINVAAVYVGLSLGPFLGGVLTEQLGWRSIFFANVPLGCIVIVLTLWKLKGEWAEARGERFDGIGSVLYSLTLVAIMYGFSQLPKTIGIWLILVGLVGLGGFFAWEMKRKSPVFDIRLFQGNKVFMFSNLAALINYSATFAVAFLLSLYLQYVKGYSPQWAGFIIVVQPFVQAVFAPFAGWLSDRIEPQIVASIGMTVTTVGLALCAFLTQTTDVGFIIVFLIILGTGFGMFSSPNTNAVMGSVTRRFYGVASATVATMRLVGMMFSMGIALLIFAVYLGRVQITPEYHALFLKAMKTAIIIFAFLCFGGVFASLARGKARPYGIKS